MVKKVLIFGASGGLATSIAEHYLALGAQVGLITRAVRRSQIEARFSAQIAQGDVQLHTVDKTYTEYIASADPAAPYDAVFFTQALFKPAPLTEMSEDRIFDELSVGLSGQILLTRSLLLAHPPEPGVRRDICFTGSTSAYAGFANTSVYCAIKHGLAGFVRALNEEFASTNTRFWLFSMGSMDTEMGQNVPKQDRLTFLQAKDVAERMVHAIEHASNMFEPEVLIRRRTLR